MPGPPQAEMGTRSGRRFFPRATLRSGAKDRGSFPLHIECVVVERAIEFWDRLAQVLAANLKPADMSRRARSIVRFVSFSSRFPETQPPANPVAADVRAVASALQNHFLCPPDLSQKTAARS